MYIVYHLSLHCYFSILYFSIQLDILQLVLHFNYWKILLFTKVQPIGIHIYYVLREVSMFSLTLPYIYQLLT